MRGLEAQILIDLARLLYVHPTSRTGFSGGYVITGTMTVEPPSRRRWLRDVVSTPGRRWVDEGVPDQVQASGPCGSSGAAAIGTGRHAAPLSDHDPAIPLAEGWLDPGEGEGFPVRVNAGEAHLKAEPLLHTEHARPDHDKTKVGVEIPVTRHFYEYVSPRPLSEIDAEVLATEARIRELLAGLAGLAPCPSGPSVESGGTSWSPGI